MTIPSLTRINELAAIRGQIDNNLLVTRIVDSEGNDVTPQKLRAAQAAKQNPQ